MSGKVKPLPVHLPLGALLILSVCACGLAAHLTFEGLVPVNGQTGFDLAAQAGHAHPAWEVCKDDFVFSSPDPLHVKVFFNQPVVHASARSFHLSISPLLPPLNA
jgi:hypothetical protein